MRKLFFVLTLAAVLLAACGPAPETAAPVAATTAPTVVAAAPTAAESQDDMGYATAPPPAAEATIPPAANADGKVEVQITLGDNWIQSSLDTFKVGVTYVFVVTNTGRRVHNFNINKAAEKNPDGARQALAGALLHVPDEQLNPGMQTTVEFTFSEPAEAGVLELACLIPRHYAMQYLPITVEP